MIFYSKFPGHAKIARLASWWQDLWTNPIGTKGLDSNHVFCWIPVSIWYPLISFNLIPQPKISDILVISSVGIWASGPWDALRCVFIGRTPFRFQHVQAKNEKAHLSFWLKQTRCQLIYKPFGCFIYLGHAPNSMKTSCSTTRGLNGCFHPTWVQLPMLHIALLNYQMVSLICIRLPKHRPYIPKWQEFQDPKAVAIFMVHPTHLT